MKIAVLGAPGAGKSELANGIVYRLPGRYMQIDNYVPFLRDRTGQEYGSFGNHIEDLQVVFKRREWEQAWRDMHTITVGTVLDSAAHCFVRAEDRARNPKELKISTDRLRAIAESFGLLYTDTWDYDYAFFLRYEGESQHSKLINAALLALLSSYRAPVLSFKPEVTDNAEKAALAARTIVALEAEQLPETPERGVRRSSEASEAERDSAESVSDVPEQGTTSDDA